MHNKERESFRMSILCVSSIEHENFTRKVETSYPDNCMPNSDPYNITTKWLAVNLKLPWTVLGMDDDNF